jgi:hypothetical protein
MWATLIAGVALFVLAVDLRTKQDLLEVYRREQAHPRSTDQLRTPRGVVVDDAPPAHPAPVPDGPLPEHGNID